MAEQEMLVAQEEDLSGGETEAETGALVEQEQVQEEELEPQDERVAELEARLEQEAGLRRGLDERLSVLGEELSRAVEGYRRALLSSEPEVPEALVQGATMEDVEGSFAQAKEVVQRIRDQLEASIARERVPAGSPPRGGVDFSGLSAREKIFHALRQG